MTKHINNIWSTTFDDNGYGPLVATDYRAMMESQGLSVTVAKSMELSYKITEASNLLINLSVLTRQSEGILEEGASKSCIRCVSRVIC